MLGANVLVSLRPAFDLVLPDFFSVQMVNFVQTRAGNSCSLCLAVRYTASRHLHVGSLPCQVWGALV
jgi:hypothetical protein